MKNPVSFSNTAVAFQYKSNADLRRAYWLFKLIGYPFLVKIGQPIVTMAIAMRLPIKGIIKSTVFKHFCGGETIRECEKAIAKMMEYHVQAILDYSGEGKESEADFEHTFKQIIETIECARNDRKIAFCVFKITGMATHALLQKVSEGIPLAAGEKAEWTKLEGRVEEICKRCHEYGVPVFVDAEESWIQPAIDDLAMAMMKKYNREKVIVYNTLQMYRTGRLHYLKEVVEHSSQNHFLPGFKLVRGAYLEKERARAQKFGYASPLHLTKEDTDTDFDLALRFCVDHISELAICAGTHNEKSVVLLLELMSEKKLPPDHPHIYFSQLYGMSDNISFNLSREGYHVSKYVPYGPVETVLPYLFRRAEENTAIAGQMGRELSLIIQEIRRRKNAKS